MQFDLISGKALNEPYLSYYILPIIDHSNNESIPLSAYNNLVAEKAHLIDEVKKLNNIILEQKNKIKRVIYMILLEGIYQNSDGRTFDFNWVDDSKKDTLIPLKFQRFNTKGSNHYGVK